MPNNVKLRVNMIWGGSFFPFGTVIEEEKIPPTLRKARYLAQPDENLIPDVLDYVSDEELDLTEEEEPIEEKPKVKFKRKI